MKLSRKTRIIGLSAILAVLVVGLGVLAWQLLAPKGEETDAPIAEGTGTEQVYVETIMEEDTGATMGSFMKHNLGLVQRRGESILFVDTKEKLCDIPPEWNTEYLSRIEKTALDGAGNLYANVYTKDKTMAILKHNISGIEEDSKVVLDGWNGMSTEQYPIPSINKFLVDEKYFYISSNVDTLYSNLQIFTLEGKLFAEYAAVGDFDIDNAGMLYITSEQKKTIEKYNVATNEEMYSEKINASMGNNRSRHLALEPRSNLLYFTSEMNVQTYNASDGVFSEVVMSFGESAPSMSSITIFMSVDSNQNIYYVAYRGDTDLLLKYALTNDFRKDMPYTLTITAPYRDDFLARAITLFEKDNPKQKIKYDYVYNSFAEFDRKSSTDGYADRSRLEQLTGNIGDIVVLDNYWGDIRSILTTDIFMDLTKKIRKDPSYEKLDSVALDAITIDKDIRGIPVMSTYLYAAVNMDLCHEMGIDIDWNTATWSDVLALNDKFKGTDKYLFNMFHHTERIFTRMLISNMPDIIDLKTKKNDLRQPWFLDLIEQWKKASESPSFVSIKQDQRLGDNALISCDGWLNKGYEKDKMGNYIIYNTVDNLNVKYFPLFCGEKNTNRTAVSEHIYSISSRTENQEGAWEFLSFLISEDAWLGKSTKPISINIDVRAAEREKGAADFDKEITDRYINDVDNICKSVDALYDMAILKEDLYKPLLKYFDGTLTLDKALAKAEHDIWIRLNE